MAGRDNIKRVADEEQAVVGVQIVVDPVVVQDAVAIVRVQHRHVLVVVIAPRRRAQRMYRKPSRSPPRLSREAGLNFIWGHEPARFRYQVSLCLKRVVTRYRTEILSDILVYDPIQISIVSDLDH